jgi:hypothetical protein
MLLRVKLAEKGSGVYSFDASKDPELQRQCPVGSSSCTIDFAKFNDTRGKALRLEVCASCQPPANEYGSGIPVYSRHCCLSAERDPSIAASSAAV